MASNQTMQLMTLSAKAANLTPAEYRAHGELFRSTANSFLQLAETEKPEDAFLVRSWQYYQDALYQFSLAGQYEEQAGKDFEAYNFTAMVDSLKETARFMEEGNRNLTLMHDSIDQSGIVY
ncbi:MAG: hypothetical protein LUP99_05460 [Methanomicrobiales archaeon]|nr:hypothetical protein [Methanomicrobiales archaeon]